jgi:hypothetical protein
MRSFGIFADVAVGWVLAPGRRTVTAMVSVTDPASRRAHDAYHRFLRDGAWAMARLWQTLATHAIARFAPDGVVALDCDDTLFHKSGRKVEGAGVFRDAVRSSAGHVAYALGLNLVVITCGSTHRGAADRGARQLRLHRKNVRPPSWRTRRHDPRAG